MPLQTLFSLIMLALAGAWTPGRNNALLARSGATFGLHATLPHIFGVALGFPLMAFTVGWFLGELFQTSAPLREVLRWGSAVLLLWAGWQIASAGAPESRAADAGAGQRFSSPRNRAISRVHALKGNPRASLFRESGRSLYAV